MTLFKKSILFLLLIQWSFCSAVYAEEPIPIESWKILGPFMIAPRDGGIDPLKKYGGERNIVPSEDQVFHSLYPANGELRWQKLEVDSDQIEVNYDDINWDSPYERLGSVGLLNLGYAYTEVESEAETMALVSTRKVPAFLVNGKVFQGEPYFGNFFKTAVKLHKGKNRILVKFAGKYKRKFRFQITPTNKKAIFLEDFTKPDLVPELKQTEFPIAVPVLNIQETWLRGARIVFEEKNGSFHQEFELDPIPPFGIVKMPLLLKLDEPRKKDLDFRIKLMREGVLDAADLSLEKKKLEEPHRITFHSKIDRSVQYFSVRYPKNYDPEKSYGVIFSLHGAGVEASHLASQYSSKDWAFVITPTNRRPYGFDWQDWGRLDFLEVYNLAMNRFPINTDRVYLSGGSMGGQGTWHIGLHHPSLFAALAPQAGWSTLHVYQPFAMQPSRMFASPEVLVARERARNDGNNLFFLENAEHLPVIITQGAKDKTVPPMHARLFRKHLEARNFDVNYRELPDKAHWWDEPRSAGGGSDALDNDEIIDFLKKRRRTVPDAFKIRLYDLSLNNRFYWIRVLSQEKPMTQTRIEASVNNGKITLKTENVRSLEIDLEQLQNEVNQVHWNGTMISVSGKSKLVLGNNFESPMAQAFRKHGAFKSVFFNPFVLVIDDDPGTLDMARLIAGGWWRRGNGYVRILKDTEVTKEVIKNFNLILLGSPSRNLMLKKLLPKTPAQLSDSGIQLDGKNFEGELSLAMIFPNPLNLKKMVAFLTGNSDKAERLSLYALPLYSGSGIPHYMIFGEDVKQYGWGGVRDAGFFNRFGGMETSP